jgi:hypothetical protein
MMVRSGILEVLAVIISVIKTIFIDLLMKTWYFQAAVLAMDESILDVDQVENLIKFCPTKEEMELLKVKLQTIKISFTFHSIFKSILTFCWPSKLKANFRHLTMINCKLTGLYRWQGKPGEVWTGLQSLLINQKFLMFYWNAILRTLSVVTLGLVELLKIDMWLRTCSLAYVTS